MERQAFNRLVNAIKSLGKENKDLEVLFPLLNAAELEAKGFDFMIDRLKRDKEIATNILNATIEDLEKTNQRIHESSEKLKIQRDELLVQKTTIEKQAVELQENFKKLKRSYDDLEQFSYVASHDLKSPLRTISNFAQLMKTRYMDSLDEQGKEFLGFIYSGVTQMDRVINDLLAYARVGHNALKIELVDLNEVVSIVEGSLKTEIETNQARIFLTEPLPSIHAVKTNMVQLFQNLFCNSIKFRREDPPTIHISFRSIHENLKEIHICDNGIGIDEQYRDKVFFPFQRLENSNKTGSGIGLAICKKIVEIHDGEITYIKNPTHGTTFIFTLHCLKHKVNSSDNVPERI